MDGVANILVERNLSKMRPKLDEFGDVVPRKTIAHVNHFYPSILIHGQADFPLFALGGFEDGQGDVFWLVPCNHGASQNGVMFPFPMVMVVGGPANGLPINLALPPVTLSVLDHRNAFSTLLILLRMGGGMASGMRWWIVCELRIDFTSTP